MGGIEGQKYPVQDIRSGGRNIDGSQIAAGGVGGNVQARQQGQEEQVSGVHQPGQNVHVPGEGTSHSAGGSSAGNPGTSGGPSDRNEYSPPPYEPRRD